MLPRTTQHRPRRAGRHAQELADLRRQQHHLEAQRRRLLEELAREPKPPSGSGGAAEPAVVVAPPGASCCGTPMREVALGQHGTWLVCSVCQARRKTAQSG